MGTWATSDKNVPGYDLLGRLEKWKKRGWLSGLAVQLVKEALQDGHDIDALYDARSRPEIVMNGEHYTVGEWQRLVNDAQMAGGEEMTN